MTGDAVAAPDGLADQFGPLLDHGADVEEDRLDAAFLKNVEDALVTPGAGPGAVIEGEGDRVRRQGRARVLDIAIAGR